MKISFKYIIIMLLFSQAATAQQLVCVGSDNLGLYQRQYPSAAAASLRATGGAKDFTYYYDSNISLWVYHFYPLEENDYTIRYVETFLGIEITNDVIARYNTIRSNLVLNAQITDASYTAKAASKIVLSPGFRVSSTTTSFNTQLVNCGSSGRLSTHIDDHVFSDHAFGEELTDQGLSVFPNPVNNGLVKFKIDGRYLPGEIRLLQATGSSVHTRRVVDNPEQEILVPAGLSSGLYVIVFKSDRGAVFFKKIQINNR